MIEKKEIIFQQNKSNNILLNSIEDKSNPGTTQQDTTVKEGSTLKKLELENYSSSNTMLSSDLTENKDKTQLEYLFSSDTNLDSPEAYLKIDKMKIQTENAFFNQSNMFFEDLEKFRNFRIVRNEEERYLKNIEPIDDLKGEIYNLEELEFKSFNKKSFITIKDYFLQKKNIKIKMNICDFQKNSSKPEISKIPKKIQKNSFYPWYLINCKLTDMKRKKTDVFRIQAYHSNPQQLLLYTFLEILTRLHRSMFTLLQEKIRTSFVSEEENSPDVLFENNNISGIHSFKDYSKIGFQTLSTINDKISVRGDKTISSIKRMFDQEEPGKEKNFFEKKLKMEIKEKNEFEKVLKKEIKEDRIGKKLKKIVEKFKFECKSISFDEGLGKYKFSERINFKKLDPEILKNINSLIESDNVKRFLELVFIFIKTEFKVLIQKKNIICLKIKDSDEVTKVRIEVKDGDKFKDLEKIGCYILLRMLDKKNYLNFLEKNYYDRGDCGSSIFDGSNEETMVER